MLLERKRKKRSSGLDGCDKRYLPLILFLVPSFLPFLQVTLMVVSPLAELLTPPALTKTRPAITIPGVLELTLPLHSCCSPTAIYISSILFFPKHTSLITIEISTSSLFFLFISSSLFLIVIHTLLNSHALPLPPAAV